MQTVGKQRGLGTLSMSVLFGKERLGQKNRKCKFHLDPKQKPENPPRTAHHRGHAAGMAREAGCLGHTVAGLRKQAVEVGL